MQKKSSMWMLLTVALVALGLMALMGYGNGATGDVPGPHPPGPHPVPPHPTPHPHPPWPVPIPVGPAVIDYPSTVVYDNSDTQAMASDMEQIRRATCYLVNFDLDRDAGKNTPVERISTVCPSFT